MRSISLLSRCLLSDRINTHGSFTFFSPVLSVHVCPMANDSVPWQMTAPQRICSRTACPLAFPHRSRLFSLTFSFLLLITIRLCLPFFLPHLPFKATTFIWSSTKLALLLMFTHSQINKLESSQSN